MSVLCWVFVMLAEQEIIFHLPTNSRMTVFLFAAQPECCYSEYVFRSRAVYGKPEGRRPLGRPRRRWVDNIRMDLQEVGCGYMDWIGLVHDTDRWRTLVSAVMNLRVP